MFKNIWKKKQELEGLQRARQLNLLTELEVLEIKKKRAGYELDAYLEKQKPKIRKKK